MTPCQHVLDITFRCSQATLVFQHVDVINVAGSCVIKQKQNQPMAQAHISKYWCNPGSVWDDAAECQVP